MADNIEIKDGLGAAQIMRTTESGGVHTPHHYAEGALLDAINDLSQQTRDLTDTLVTLLSAVFEKMPRVTNNDQAAVSVETGTVAVSSLPTLANVTTVATVTTVGTTNLLTNQTQVGGQEALTFARSNIMSGTSHIYNGIEVS